MKKYLIAIVLFILPTFVCRYLFLIFRLKTHRIAKGCRIGFSMVICDSLQLGQNTRIGHLNFIKIKKIELNERSKILHLNVLKGPISVCFDEDSWIHSQNKISGPVLSFVREQKFCLGKKSMVMMKCLFDITDSIEIGENTTIAGAGVQMWTHAFYVGKENRVRVDGGIRIGNNCYIGAYAVVCSGCTITDCVSIGANATVSKSITVPGLYVSQPLRFIEFDADKSIANLKNEIYPGIFERDRTS